MISALNMMLIAASSCTIYTRARLIDLPGKWRASGMMHVDGEHEAPNWSLHVYVDDALYNQYSHNNRAKNAKMVATEMCAMTEEEPFCIAFMMAILAIYLAPNTSVAVNRSFLGAAQQLDKLKQMDWCNLVADCLIKGIREYKESDALFVHVKGCVHILSVIFIDLVKHAAFEVPNGFPRLSVVTTEHNKWVASHPFGSLQVHRLEDSVYAPVLNNMGHGNIVEGGKCADSETNTDAQADQFAITDTDENNKHPVSAELGNARTTHNMITDGVQAPPEVDVGRNRGSPSTMEKDNRSAKKARAELPSSGQVKPAGEVTIKMDMSLLNCRVCSRPIKPPVFQCNAGHLACGRCLAELPGEQCQTCEHGGGFSRCPAMDAVVSSTVKCRHDGCGSDVPYNELEDHQSTCLHAPCFCMEPGCGFVGAPLALLSHLGALHTMPVHKVHYGKVHRFRVSEPQCLLHGQGDDSVCLLAVGALDMATVVSAVCIRAGASPCPRYAVKVWANGPPLPSSAAGSILLDMKAVTSSTRPGEVAVQERPHAHGTLPAGPSH
ncbi:uncharacterized protein [Triticum aestivum]|uniref:uncharacterized protein n=1 Tax=Triticum aestivum TaxID=4565 RepID=UPI001D022630|nr:uncharacterized protein LOC123056618 [Triticum aestivum]